MELECGVLTVLKPVDSKDQMQLPLDLLILMLLLALLLLVVPISAVHGGIVLALAGKDSVTLAVDSRFSSHSTGTLLLGEQPRGVYRVGSHTLVACIGV